MDEMPEPIVQARATVLGPESTPPSALPKGLVFATQELAQTEVSQAVTDTPALLHSVVMLDWHPAGRLSAEEPALHAQARYALQELWNPCSVAPHWLSTHDAHALPFNEARSVVAHALAPWVLLPSGSPGGSAGFELHPDARHPNAK